MPHGCVGLSAARGGLQQSTANLVPQLPKQPAEMAGLPAFGGKPRFQRNVGEWLVRGVGHNQRNTQKRQSVQTTFGDQIQSLCSQLVSFGMVCVYLHRPNTLKP